MICGWGRSHNISIDSHKCSLLSGGHNKYGALQLTETERLDLIRPGIYRSLATRVHGK